MTAPDHPPHLDLPRCRTTLLAAVRAAGALQLRGQREFKVQGKGPFDIVTDVDHACERAVVALLREAHPDHGILGEEGTSEGEGAELLWILDPLDGTKNYAHGYPRFCVSLALTHRRQPILGAVYNAVSDELFCAERGAGATLNGSPFAVSTTSELSAALVAGALTTRGQPDPQQTRRVQALLPHVQAFRSNGSAALDLCDVACGRLDAYFEEGLKPWDTAAGVLMVREAGGVTSDFSGESHRLFGDQTVASNALLHRSVLPYLEARASA